MKILSGLVCILLVGYVYSELKETTWAAEPTPSDDFTCPNNNEEGGSHADPNNCQRYFVCTNGFAWEYHCPGGLYFNPATNECDFPENTKCTPSPTTISPTTVTPSTPPSSTPPASTPSLLSQGNRNVNKF